MIASAAKPIAEHGERPPGGGGQLRDEGPRGEADGEGREPARATRRGRCARWRAECGGWRPSPRPCRHATRRTGRGRRHRRRRPIRTRTGPPTRIVLRGNRTWRSPVTADGAHSSHPEHARRSDGGHDVRFGCQPGGVSSALSPTQHSDEAIAGEEIPLGVLSELVRWVEASERAGSESPAAHAAVEARLAVLREAWPGLAPADRGLLGALVTGLVARRPRAGDAVVGAGGGPPAGGPRAPRRAPPAAGPGPRDRGRPRRARRPGGDGHRLGQVALLPGPRRRARRPDRRRLAAHRADDRPARRPRAGRHPRGGAALGPVRRRAAARAGARPRRASCRSSTSRPSASTRRSSAGRWPRRGSGCW